MKVQSRAHRILKDLSNYRDLSNITKEGVWGDLGLQEGEGIIGIYENVPDSLENAIIVTKFGLHIQRAGRWKFINYDEIENSFIPSGNKHKADRISITLVGGKEVFILIEGGNDKFRDVFEFLRFLDRVSKDKSIR